MQRVSPERVRAPQAKGSEINSPELTGAEQCGPHRACCAQQTNPLASLTLTFLQPWPEHPEASPAPSVTMAFVEGSFCPF